MQNNGDILFTLIYLVLPLRAYLRNNIGFPIHVLVPVIHALITCLNILEHSRSFFFLLKVLLNTDTTGKSYGLHKKYCFLSNLFILHLEAPL